MELFNGFHIEFWEELGFMFRHEKKYEGYEIKHGQAIYDSFEFKLQISSSVTLASVYNNLTKINENHAVSEDEAIEWFSRESAYFYREMCSTIIKLKANRLSHLVKP